MILLDGGICDHEGRNMLMPRSSLTESKKDDKVS